VTVTHGLVTLDLEDPPPPSAPDDQEPGPFSSPGGPERSRPGGLAVSGVLHVVAVFLLVQAAIVHAPEAPHVAPPVPIAKAVVVPPAELRKILGLRPLPPPPRPTPPPPEAGAKDRVSIGSALRPQARDRIEMRPDEDLSAVPKGTPVVGTTAAAAAPPPPPAAAPGAPMTIDGRLVQKVERPTLAPGPILASLRRLGNTGTAGTPGLLGSPTGTERELSGLKFDPQGADFTEWAQRFQNEVYRNWIAPPAAVMGWGGGECEFQFVVDRSGAVTEVNLIASTGIPAYDRAARNALLSARLLPLPADYAPATLPIHVIFSYGTARPAQGGHSGR